MELASGYPGYNGRIPKEAAMLPAVLRSAGYITMALGKWHLTPVEDITPVGPFDQWPLGQGFDRYYGYHGSGDRPDTSRSFTRIITHWPGLQLSAGVAIT